MTNTIPGIDDLDDISIHDPAGPIRSEAKSAILDVMLGIPNEQGIRDTNGLNSHLRYGKAVSRERMVFWQARLQQALEKLQ